MKAMKVNFNSSLHIGKILLFKCELFMEKILCGLLLLSLPSKVVTVFI